MSTTQKSMPAVELNPLPTLPAYPNIDVDPDEVFDRKAQDWTEALIPLTEQENANIATYNANLPAINTVLANMPDINTVAGIDAEVSRVAAITDSVTGVNGVKDQVVRIAQSVNAVDRVNVSIINVDRVAQSADNIDRVHASVAAVDTTALNMPAVIAAPAYAADAKYWAEQAEAIADIGPATEAKSGIIRIATAAEADAGTSTDTAVTPALLLASMQYLVKITGFFGPDVAPVGHPTTFTLTAASSLVGGAVVSFIVSGPGMAEQTLPATNGTATVTYTAPADTPVGQPLTLTAVAVDNSGYKSATVSKTVTAVQAYVVAPTITSPGAGATVSTTEITIQSSAFATVGQDDTHLASYWFIYGDAEKKNLLWSSGRTTTNLTSVTANPTVPLTFDTNVFIYVAYEGTLLGRSTDSQPLSVVVGSIMPPVLGNIIDGAVNVRPRTAITVGAFSTNPAGLDTAKAVDNFAYSFVNKVDNTVIEQGFKTFLSTGGSVQPVYNLPTLTEIEFSGNWIGKLSAGPAATLRYTTVDLPPVWGFYVNDPQNLYKYSIISCGAYVDGVCFVYLKRASNANVDNTIGVLRFDKLGNLVSGWEWPTADLTAINGTKIAIDYHTALITVFCWGTKGWTHGYFTTIDPITGTLVNRLNVTSPESIGGYTQVAYNSAKDCFIVSILDLKTAHIIRLNNDVPCTVKDMTDLTYAGSSDINPYLQSTLSNGKFVLGLRVDNLAGVASGDIFHFFDDDGVYQRNLIVAGTNVVNAPTHYSNMQCMAFDKNGDMYFLGGHSDSGINGPPYSIGTQFILRLNKDFQVVMCARSNDSKETGYISHFSMAGLVITDDCVWVNAAQQQGVEAARGRLGFNKDTGIAVKQLSSTFGIGSYTDNMYNQWFTDKEEFFNGIYTGAGTTEDPHKWGWAVIGADAKDYKIGNLVVEDLTYNFKTAAYSVALSQYPITPVVTKAWPSRITVTPGDRFSSERKDFNGEILKAKVEVL